SIFFGMLSILPGSNSSGIKPGPIHAARSGGTGSLQLMDYPWPPPYRTRAVQQLIKGLAWGPPTSRAVWAALESPITATAAPTSTTSLPATSSHWDGARRSVGASADPRNQRPDLHAPDDDSEVQAGPMRIFAVPTRQITVHASHGVVMDFLPRMARTDG